MLVPNASFSIHTILSSIVTVLVIATILLPLIVWLLTLIFSIAVIPWSVKTGVPAGKQIGETVILPVLPVLSIYYL